MEREPAEGFTLQTVCRLTGVSSGKLKYWRHTGLISPSQLMVGKVFRRRYSFMDLVQIKTTRMLREKGISLQKIRKCLEFLKTKIPDMTYPLADLKFITDGETIFVLTANREKAIDTLEGGQLVFSIALGELITQAREQVKNFLSSSEVGNGG